MSEQDFMEVEARVAEIFDSNRVALTKGRNAGVEVGSKVTVWSFVDVTDPETDEPLGTVQIDRLKMVVTSVQDFLCVAAVDESPNWIGTVMFRSSKKIRTSSGGSDENSVKVGKGDQVTIYVDSLL